MNANRIEELEKKMRDLIRHELRFEHIKNPDTNEPVAVAKMPFISVTEQGNLPDETTLYDFRNHIRDKVFDYFYSEMFEFMRELKKEKQ